MKNPQELCCVYEEVEEREGSYDAFGNEKEWRIQTIVSLRCGHVFIIVESATISFPRNIQCQLGAKFVHVTN